MFTSPDGSRLHESGAVRAFRCQLPRINQYYSPEPSTDELPPALSEQAASIASRLDPWHASSQDLKTETVSTGLSTAPTLFKEFEMVVDAEDEVPS